MEMIIEVVGLDCLHHSLPITIPLSLCAEHLSVWQTFSWAVHIALFWRMIFDSFAFVVCIRELVHGKLDVAKAVEECKSD